MIYVLKDNLCNLLLGSITSIIATYNTKINSSRCKIKVWNKKLGLCYHSEVHWILKFLSN